ncbi:hypothetical protein WPG_0925 [Winogradskyella sp. PG-2]|nr:hypothetical protein WPG_0925 [Winogradskyella sp. PG-2]
MGLLMISYYRFKDFNFLIVVGVVDLSPNDKGYSVLNKTFIYMLQKDY